MCAELLQIYGNHGLVFFWFVCVIACGCVLRRSKAMGFRRGIVVCGEMKEERSAEK